PHRDVPTMTDPVTIGVSERVLERAQERAQERAHQQQAGRPADLPPNAPDAVRVHPADDVAVAVRPLTAGTRVEVPGAAVTLAEDVPAGHKIALRDLAKGEPVTKYGMPIGAATADVAAGQWIHSHNLATRL